jgi:hypothetical protein
MVDGKIWILDLRSISKPSIINLVLEIGYRLAVLATSTLKKVADPPGRLLRRANFRAPDPRHVQFLRPQTLHCCVIPLLRPPLIQSPR